MRSNSVRRPTIQDVAERAGVSKTVVSHALSGKRPVAEETRQRILEAIAELGYEPHPLAQRLAGGRTGIIGFAYPLVTPRIANLEMKIIAGAANVLNQANYDFLLMTHSAPGYGSLRRVVQSGLVDGVILLQVRMVDPRIEILRQANIPFVLFGRCADTAGLMYVDMDVEHAMRQCVAHLAELGHQHIVYCYQDDRGFGLVERALESFASACIEHHLASAVLPCGVSPEAGAAAVLTLLEQYPQTTGVIFWTDIAAWGAYQTLRERGIRVPQDLSLICFDRSTVESLGTFHPTAVDIRAEELSAQAARMLIALLNNEPLEVTQVLIQPHFILGESTAGAPATPSRRW
ncbi:MAG: LacI family DNA-binding transcriptional regulator [Anaerolineae bacterium]